MKKLILFILMTAMVLTMCGCGKKSVTMNVSVYYFGTGLEGTAKMNGQREFVIENIREGDLIYEYPDGELSKEFRGGRREDGWFMKIEHIGKDGLTIMVNTTSGGIVSHERFQGKEFRQLYSTYNGEGFLYYSYDVKFE